MARTKRTLTDERDDVVDGGHDVGRGDVLVSPLVSSVQSRRVHAGRGVLKHREIRRKQTSECCVFHCKWRFAELDDKSFCYRTVRGKKNWSPNVRNACGAAVLGVECCAYTQVDYSLTARRPSQKNFLRGDNEVVFVTQSPSIIPCSDSRTRYLQKPEGRRGQGPYSASNNQIEVFAPGGEDGHGSRVLKFRGFWTLDPLKRRRSFTRTLSYHQTLQKLPSSGIQH